MVGYWIGYVLGVAIGLYSLYWVVRLAVTHALRSHALATVSPKEPRAPKEDRVTFQPSGGHDTSRGWEQFDADGKTLP